MSHSALSWFWCIDALPKMMHWNWGSTTQKLVFWKAMHMMVYNTLLMDVYILENLGHNIWCATF